MVTVKSGPGIHGFFAIPHGVLSLFPMVVAPVALTLHLISGLTCHFLEHIVETTSYRAAAFNDLGNITHIDTDITTNRFTYGLRYYQCHDSMLPGDFEFEYPDGNLFGDSRLTDDEVNSNPFNPFSDPDYSEQTEEKFRSAMACTFVGIILGGMAMIFLHLGTCISYRRVILILMGFGFFVASLFAFLSLVAFSSELCGDPKNTPPCIDAYRNRTRVEELELEIPLDNVCNKGCRFGPGAGAAVGAGVLWFLAAIFTCILQTDDDGDEGEGASSAKSSSNDGKQQEQASEREPLTQGKNDAGSMEPQVIYQYEDEDGNIHEGAPPMRGGQGGQLEESAF